MSWHQGLLVSFDLETTGTDVEQDRIVTAALLRLEGDGRPAAKLTWLVDPGVPIPDEAAAIHGISTAYVQEHGRAPATAIEEITEALADALRAEIPLVVMNARYDLSLLDRECRRHGLRTLTERLGHAPAPVIDPSCWTSMWTATAGEACPSGTLRSLRRPARRRTRGGRRRGGRGRRRPAHRGEVPGRRPPVAPCAAHPPGAGGRRTSRLVPGVFAALR